MKKATVFFFQLLLLSSTLYAQSEPNVPAPAARGIYAIWYQGDPGVLRLPYIKGGQIVLQWAQVEPQEGKYDFSEMDKLLQQFKDQDRMTTIQVNGNKKPDWLFKKLPYHPEKLSHQIGDEKGSLMYWHPDFITAYSNFIKAYASHLKKSDNLSALAGVRMNFDAFGTEHFPVPADKRSLDQWILPPGVKQGVEWTEAIAEKYQDEISEVFIESFSGINLFLRNNISAAVEARHKQALLDGRLMLFHTSSEIEPRSEMMEHNYNLFNVYARSGHTLAYAEPWADSWGNHGGKQDPRWTSPPQYIYWRLLFDLHNGVSLIAIYSRDLGVALHGKASMVGEVSQYQESFSKAIKFASVYAGYHASPGQAPGAWVAFRHNEKNVSYKTLKTFTGNYDFLMHELPESQLKWQAVTEAGPALQRFGAWAKTVKDGGKIELQLSELFASSLKGKPATLRIIYLDSSNGSFESRFSGQTIKTILQGTNTWKTLELPLTSADFEKNSAGAHISLTALSGDLTLHMVNVERGDGLPGEVTGAVAKKNGKTIRLTWKNPASADLDHTNIYQGSILLKSVNSVQETAEIKNATNDPIMIRTVDEAGRESKGISIHQ